MQYRMRTHRFNRQMFAIVFFNFVRGLLQHSTVNEDLKMKAIGKKLKSQLVGFDSGNKGGYKICCNTFCSSKFRIAIFRIRS
jgi:hypothetical protein